LNKFKKHRANERFGENLQQQPWLSIAGAAVEQNAATLQFRNGLTVTRQPFIQHLVVGIWRRRHKRHACCLESIPDLKEVVAGKRDMLNPLAVVGHEKFFNLTCAFGRLFVQRNSNQAIGRRQRLGEKPRVLALDIEVSDFAEIKDALVKVCPVVHATAIDIVSQMIDHVEPAALGMPVNTVEIVEVDIVDRAALLEPIDKIQRRAADTLDGRQPQFHRTGFYFDRLGAKFQRTRVGKLSIVHPESHTARRRPVLLRKVKSVAVAFVVDQKINLALTIKLHILAAVIGNVTETRRGEDGLDHASFERGKLYKLKTAEPHRVV